MIMGSSKPGESCHQRSEKIQRAALRAADLVNQILSFSRRREGERRSVKIHPVAREVLRLLRGSIPSTITIIDRIDRNCGYIKADPTQIHQVFMNLCTNAYHAMEDTGGELVVSLAEKTIGPKDELLHPGLVSGRYLCLEVKDTGCGIPGEFVEKIFDPYYTTKEEGKGTGLGLATVYGIVKSYHGEVTVSTVPGKGSCFTIFFPVVEVESEALPPEPTDRFEGRGQTILFVDDDKDIADMFREGLEILGYEVVVKYSGVDALEYFRQNPGKIDLMVTDQTMPHMTGIDLARKLLAIDSSLPVILCSGYSGDVNVKKAGDTGIQSFLMKPFTVGELSKTIQEVLR
jgi:CheY-like chemotaxis protein